MLVMVGTVVKASFLILILNLVGCSSDMDNQSAEIVDLLTVFDFENGDQEWEGGISDFPADYGDSSKYLFDNSQVPLVLPVDGNGLSISADNPHGDLFYYFMRKVSGLESNRKYKIDFEFLVYTELLTQASKPSSDELYLKVGAVGHEPELKKTVWQNSMDYIALDVDKGETNSSSGSEIINIGSVKQFTSETPEVISGNTFDFVIEVETNNDGVVWLVMGIDSGIKSQLNFGMAAVTVYFREKK
jgi:hypothetical protein